MIVSFQYGKDELLLRFPDDSLLYKSKYKTKSKSAAELLFESIASPIGGNTLGEMLLTRKAGKVVIVVSDITRPIPYSKFLPELIALIETSGVKKEEITILVATGMHRPSTRDEHQQMFGKYILNNYFITDHDCENREELLELPGRSWSGSKISLNKHYVDAGFRIVTGLVEPHFMAGFSGGRKAICPGLVGLDAVQKFHGFSFLSHPNATSAILKDNPCHEENTSIARLCPPDYAINIVLDTKKDVNSIVSGELFASHLAAVDYVKSACCPEVSEPADVVVTSCGGNPLDTTFYQCVKGFVSCLPAVKHQGEIISFGSCSEGIGSPEYTAIMKKYADNYSRFIEDIKNGPSFIKDQWEFQMHIRALEKTGQQNLHFFTSGIPAEKLFQLSVNPHYAPASEIKKRIQSQINLAVSDQKKIAVFPEGPYCTPVTG
ncbi:MAG: nickel-dependent lactate racemase [Prolixibacteraceae bacterium]